MRGTIQRFKKTFWWKQGRRNFDPVSSRSYLYFMFLPIMMFRLTYGQTKQDHGYGLFSDTKIIASTCIISRLKHIVTRLFEEIYPRVIFK